MSTTAQKEALPLPQGLPSMDALVESSKHVFDSRYNPVGPGLIGISEAVRFWTMKSLINDAPVQLSTNLLAQTRLSDQSVAEIMDVAARCENEDARMQSIAVMLVEEELITRYPEILAEERARCAEWGTDWYSAEDQSTMLVRLARNRTAMGLPPVDTI